MRHSVLSVLSIIRTLTLDVAGQRYFQAVTPWRIAEELMVTKEGMSIQMAQDHTGQRQRRVYRQVRRHLEDLMTDHTPLISRHGAQGKARNAYRANDAMIDSAITARYNAAAAVQQAREAARKEDQTVVKQFLKAMGLTQQGYGDHVVRIERSEFAEMVRALRASASMRQRIVFDGGFVNGQLASHTDAELGEEQAELMARIIEVDALLMGEE